MAAMVSSWVDTVGHGGGWEESDHQPLPQPGPVRIQPTGGSCRLCWAPVLSTAPRTTLPISRSGVPSPTFHVLQGSVQPVNAPLEHEAELEAEQGVRDEGL